MESEEDHEQMLKAIFDSCDPFGLGCLAYEDFQILCKKLPMQEDQCLSLVKALFPETNFERLITYETFHETLILILTGGQLIDETLPSDSDVALNESGEDTRDILGEIELDNVPERLSRTANEPGRDIVYDGHESIDGTHKYSDISQKLETSSNKRKKYGRRSEPDADLLRGRCSEDPDKSSPALREIRVPDTSNDDCYCEERFSMSPRKAVDIPADKENSLTSLQDEVFAGNGGDDDWKNPDAEWMASMNTKKQDSENSSMKTVEAAWWRVVGDPVTDGMDETKLGDLCFELRLHNISRPEDISELFEALDHDADGLVMFQEFSEQMLAYLDCPPPEEKIDSNISDDYDIISSAECEPCLDKEHCDDTNNNTFSIQTPMQSNERRTPSVSGSYLATSPNSDTDDGSSPNMSSSSGESRTPLSCAARLSLDSDTSPFCPPVVSVEPRQLANINRSRRRRRSSAVAASNPGGTRNQRRRSARSVPLPHHHPASIRQLEELPLSYLAEENERYVSVDTLLQCWETEGLENSEEVLEALQLSPNEKSVSLVALSEAFEMEFDRNLVEKAAYILYKRGIRYYRDLSDQREDERNNHVNKINFLTSQLLEQEARLEKVEANSSTKHREKESRYMDEIRALADELSDTQAKLRVLEEISDTRQDEEIADLTTKYGEMKESYDELKRENAKLSRLIQETEAKLLETENVKKILQDDIEATRAGLEHSNRMLARQRKRFRDVFDILKHGEDEFQVMEHRNEQLLGGTRKFEGLSVSSPASRLHTGTPRQGPPELPISDSSCYSTASEGQDIHPSRFQSTPIKQFDNAGSLKQIEQDNIIRREDEHTCTQHTSQGVIKVTKNLSFQSPSHTRSVPTNSTGSLI